MDPAAIDTARVLCLAFEGLILQPYLCPANVPTIGVGTTRYEDGTAVTLADPPIDRSRALQLLEHELRDLAPRVMRLCPVLADWPPEAQGAILDFTFNLGPGNLQASTLRRRINAADRHGARAELARWVYGGGRRLPGLVRRRAAEAALL